MVTLDRRRREESRLRAIMRPSFALCCVFALLLDFWHCFLVRITIPRLLLPSIKMSNLRVYKNSLNFPRPPSKYQTGQDDNKSRKIAPDQG